MLQDTGAAAHIEATTDGDGIVTVHYSVFYKEGKNPLAISFSFVYEEENNQYVLSYLVENGEENLDILSYLKVMPYYGVEMNEQFLTLQDLLQDRNLLSFLHETFDKCYMEKMGVCFTNVTQYKAMLYLVKIEVSDKAVQYATRYAKELNREEKERERTANLLLVAFGLLILIGLVLLLRKCLKIEQ